MVCVGFMGRSSHDELEDPRLKILRQLCPWCMKLVHDVEISAVVSNTEYNEVHIWMYYKLLCLIELVGINMGYSGITAPVEMAHRVVILKNTRK